MGKLSSQATEEDLHKLFDKFGKIAELKVMRDQEKKSRWGFGAALTRRGFGFVTFENREDASKALEEKWARRARVRRRFELYGSELVTELSRRNKGYKPTPGVCSGFGALIEE